ncbi:MAG: hypothetical protein IJ563_07745 [Selenomonadaceae bacterium]|nr:hypothetical protein [Selenomonadaceae bacterium]MBR1858586.1 hypothetical protein [Selenomonadaceae bacterium]
MVPVAIMLGALIGGILVVASWDDIVKWLDNLLPQINEKLAGIVKHKAKLFSSVKDQVLSLVHKLYYKENGKFYEQTTTREIDESQVPDWAKAELGEEETDVTDRYKEELQLEI